MIRLLKTTLLGSLLCLSLTLQAEDPDKAKKDNNRSPVEDIAILVDVFHQIRTHYVNDVSDQELLEYALRGMLEGLDPHSDYLDQSDFQDLQESTSGEFAGLGLEVTRDNGFIKVVAPIDDSPAKKAGVLAGDLIIKLDDKSVKGLGLDESIELMRGKEGSKISLTLLRDGEDAPITIELERAIIKVKSVKSRTLEPGFGYLRIAQFQKRTAEEVEEHIKNLLKNNENNLKGLVIDLRNNPGGLLTGAVEISSYFVDNKLIVYTEGRLPESRENYHANKASLINPNTSIVVLINGGSASASEIVAGALQDHKRALIVGTTSFGKGSVQTILPLPRDESRGIKLTTARYYTPSGRSIQAEGIIPDIEVPLAKVTPVAQKNQLKEKNLSKHLENKGDDGVVESQPSSELIKKDFQLHEALNLLKAITIAQQANNSTIDEDDD